MPVYNPNIPTGTIPLNQDYLNLQNNFNQANIAFGGDHVPFTDTSGLPPTGITGMHTPIHMVPISTSTTNPPNNYPPNGYTAVTGYGQLINAVCNDGYSTDNTLFFLTGKNRLQQLTRNLTPQAVTNGYTFIPGGLILQWGTASITGSKTVSFNAATSINILNMQTTFIGSSSSSNTLSIVSVTPGSPGSFTWNFTGSTSYTQFYWVAIGT